ncbi:5-methylcytosine rRNA methyltransferase NSUN4 [Planococcus citri]|uniref:5-methylcytosine rRNA methyltransferase NSUN4 n=1 Tax=Planococcus citri TaxID=170843 RepID=UPI0031F7D575
MFPQCRCSTSHKNLQNLLIPLREWKRFYKKSIHWTKYENRDFPRYRALTHFDDFYKNIYGEKLWRSLRLGLLCNNKYCAVVNNFSEPDAVKENLQNRGALNMRELLALVEEKREERSETAVKKVSSEEGSLERRMEEAIEASAKRDLISGTYSKYDYVNVLDEHYKDAKPPEKKDEPKETEEPKEYEGKLSLAEGIKDAHIDHRRIINIKDGLSTSTLYEFVPASKIKGIDRIMSETAQLEFYKQSVDFPINVEKQLSITFPEHLDIYSYEKCNVTSFPHPERGRTGVFDFYLLDGASILPVLALDLKPGDRLLDMCGAPGGKSMTAFQTLSLDELVCNDSFKSRVNRISRIVKEYLYNCPQKERFKISHRNGLNMTERDLYNKILVDVPCTNDRRSVNKDEGNWFETNRMQQRLRLPELQADLLTNALRLVAPGGTVVYSTCSLSPVQNDGVVQMALKNLWEENEYEFVVQDMTEAFRPAEVLYCFGENVGLKYGIVVLPHLTANFGPLYFSKIVKK